MKSTDQSNHRMVVVKQRHGGVVAAKDLHTLIEEFQTLVLKLKLILNIF